MLGVVAPDREGEHHTPLATASRHLLRPYRHGLTMKALSLPKSVACAPQNANVREIPVKAVKLAFESFASNAVLGLEATDRGEVTIGRAVRGDKQGTAVTFFFISVVVDAESCSDPCSKHGCGRVQLERCRVGTMAVLAQVQYTSHWLTARPQIRL